MKVLERERDKERNNENETSLKGENERDDKRRRAQAAQVSHAGTNKSQLKSSNKSGASSTLKRTVRSKHHDGSEVDNDDGLFDSNSSSASQSHSTSPVTSKSKRNRHIDTSYSDGSVNGEDGASRRQSKVNGDLGDRGRKSVRKKLANRSPTESEVSHVSPIGIKRPAGSRGTNGNIIPKKSIPKKHRPKSNDGEISLLSGATPRTEKRKIDSAKLQRQMPPNRSLSPHMTSLSHNKESRDINTSETKRTNQVARSSDPSQRPKMTESEIKRAEYQAMRKLDSTVADILKPLRPNGPPTASVLSITNEPSRSNGMIDWEMSFADPIDFLDAKDAQYAAKNKQIPLYPEDFPEKISTHELHWWGVVEPPQHLLTLGKNIEDEKKKLPVKARISPQLRSDEIKVDDKRYRIRTEDKNGWPNRDHGMRPPSHGPPRGFDRRRDEEWQRFGPAPQPPFPGYNRFDNGPPPEFNDRNGPPRYGGYPDERGRGPPHGDRGRKR